MPASPLYALHRVLISLAIALGVLVLVYGVLRFARTGDGWALAMGVGGVVAAGALALYLRWFLRKQARS
ncbi:MAG TPA: hypothetical protein VKN99_04040 [Polyangia bacterium]|nr:hypothetical protein [Polyangia bacterium]